ncbi:MAG TPA: DUF1993 domain-containing protein [Casimicrobiaceae bacterium]
MPLSMYQSSIPVFIKTLTSLKSVLEKGAAHAQAKKIDDTVLLQSRLYPDMLPLTAQVQIAADMTRGCVDRLTGSEPDSWEDNEKTFADLIARLDRTIAYLESVNEKQLDGAETRSVTRKLRGQPKTFTGVNYLQQFVLPNLFFHATTTYAILRHSGVELGKLDFLGPLD